MKAKAPQDSTRRNVQAANKKIASLAERIKKLEARIRAVEKLCKGK
jgi:hypothetical protein